MINLLKRIIKSIDYRIESKLHPIEFARKMGTKVGDNCRFINFPMLGSEPYLIEIGDHVTISSDVVFSTHDGGSWVFREEEKYKNALKFGKIKIGNNCFVGIRTVILPGVTIGNNCVIGACSLVTKHVPSGEVWGGVPAHFISTTEDYAKKTREALPDLNIDNFRKDKKEELLRVLSK